MSLNISGFLGMTTIIIVIVPLMMYCTAKVNEFYFDYQENIFAYLKIVQSYGVP